MSINIEQIIECPNCGVEFEQTKPNYNFCSYQCFKDYRQKSHIPFDGERWLGAALYYFDIQLGYARPKEWLGNEQHDLMWEFSRLIGRDS